jgi:hypothetical protein
MDNGKTVEVVFLSELRPFPMTKVIGCDHERFFAPMTGCATPLVNA